LAGPYFGDVMILKNIFAEKIAKKLAFLTKNKAKLFKIMIITLVFEKNANFFAKNCQKSQKIVTVILTPGHPGRIGTWSLSTTTALKL
jgi:hypothetical protein